MDGKNIAKIFENKFKNEFKQSGYQFNVSSDWYRTSVVVSKKSEKVHHYFRFLIEQNTDKTLIVFGFWLHASFPELEKILRGILKKNNLIGTSSKYDEVLDSFKIKNDLKNTLPEDGLEIKSDKDIEYIMDLFYKFYKEDVFPYFEKWQNITALYEFIKNKNDEELWDIFGQFAPMKKAVIYRLCNDKSALKLITNYYKDQKGYYEEDSKDVDNVRYYNASKELKEILEVTKPIYNIEL